MKDIFKMTYVWKLLYQS